MLLPQVTLSQTLSTEKTGIPFRSDSTNPGLRAAVWSIRQSRPRLTLQDNTPRGGHQPMSVRTDDNLL